MQNYLIVKGQIDLIDNAIMLANYHITNKLEECEPFGTDHYPDGSLQVGVLHLKILLHGVQTLANLVRCV